MHEFLERERERIQRELFQKWFPQIHSAQRTLEKAKADRLIGFESIPNDETFIQLFNWLVLKWKKWPSAWGNEPYNFLFSKTGFSTEWVHEHCWREPMVLKMYTPGKITFDWQIPSHEGQKNHSWLRTLAVDLVAFGEISSGDRSCFWKTVCLLARQCWQRITTEMGMGCPTKMNHKFR